jgi:hypothetical protein
MAIVGCAFTQAQATATTGNAEALQQQILYSSTMFLPATTVKAPGVLQLTPLGHRVVYTLGSHSQPALIS